MASPHSPQPPPDQTRPHRSDLPPAPSRIALLGLYPADPTRITGGVEAVVYILAHALAALPGLEVHVISGSPAVRRISVETDGPVVVHRVPELPLGRLFLLRTDWYWLRRALRSVRSDVVHAHGAGTYADAAISSGLPAVVTLHGVVAQEARLAMPRGGWGARLRWQFDLLYERYCLARTRNLIIISPYLLRQFPWLARRAHLSAIENPIAAPFFDLARIPPADGAANILCPARIIARKGIIDLIEAFAHLASDFPQAHLRLAGEFASEPAYVADCQRAIAAHGLAHRIHLLGGLTVAQLQQELAVCAVLALAAHQETAPVTLAEGMAAGCPIVAASVGGVPDLIEDGQTGLLVPPGASDLLTAQLRRLLADPALAQRLGAAAHQAAQTRFHPHAIALRTRAVYDELYRRAHHPDRGRSA